MHTEARQEYRRTSEDEDHATQQQQHGSTTTSGSPAGNQCTFLAQNREQELDVLSACAEQQI